MKRKISAIALAMFLFALLPLQTWAAELLIPVGKIVGLQLLDNTLTVVAYDDIFGSCARDAGLKIGDELVKVNGDDIAAPQDLRDALEDQAGCPVELTVRRDGKLNTVQLTPRQTDEGPRIGVYLRQGVAGIGTVTFYDPDTGAFGALGHGVSTAQGALVELTRGGAYPARIQSVKKGRCGEPGQLKGSADPESPLGPLLRNTPQGVFGVTKQGWKGIAIPTAAYEQIHTGPAVIRSTTQGDQVQEYSVEILKIYPENRADCRNFLIKVTDPALLKTTGGIVQGMSGSPIIQDGRLIGAVTHVLVNDPTTGYGIFIENMLNAADQA